MYLSCLAFLHRLLHYIESNTYFMLWFGSVCFSYFGFCHVNFFSPDVLDALTWSIWKRLSSFLPQNLHLLPSSSPLWLFACLVPFHPSGLILKILSLINKILLFTILNFVYLFICSLSNLCKFRLLADRKLVFLSCQKAGRHSAHIWWVH